jgi:hypothetical protein
MDACKDGWIGRWTWRLRAAWYMQGTRMDGNDNNGMIHGTATASLLWHGMSGTSMEKFVSIGFIMAQWEFDLILDHLRN